MGSMMKGIWGGISEKRDNQHRIELARELNRSENDERFQQMLTGGVNSPDSAYVRHTRRLLALICVGTLCAVTLLTTIFPSAEITTLTTNSGELQRNFLGLFRWVASPKTITVTTGHIALFNATIIFPMILGFYFTPGGRS